MLLEDILECLAMMRMMISMIRRYSELKQYDTFIDRYNYLKLVGQVGVETFGMDRYLNQTLYRSSRWRKTRNEVIIRDNGCDLGIDGYDIFDKIIIHHMNPLTLEDIEEDVPEIYEPEFLISCSFITHNAIHYGDESLLPKLPIDRKPGDTCLWK